MSFAHPSVLWGAAVLLPLLALFFFWSWRTRRRLISEFVPARLQETLTLGVSPRRARWRAILVLGIIGALALALARPRYGAGAVEVSQRGLDILIGIDTSRSMLAEDAGPGISRLQRAKLAALDLAKLAKSDRVGLIAFAGSAFLQCPLTVDDEAFRQGVDALDTDIIPQGGTAIGPAIEAALETSRGEKDNVRVLVLFTDGEEHETGAVEAAKAAASKGLRVFTVGVGTTRGEIIRVRDKSGNLTYLKDDQGNVVKSTLNEALLREVAEATGGFYLPLQGPRVMSDLFTQALEPLPRSDLASRVIEQYHERFQWPLALALVLLALETLMPEQARVRGSARQVRLNHPSLARAAESGATLFLALTLALTFVSFRSAASPRSALKQYEKGDFEAAQSEYERLAKNRPDDPRYKFNAGTAAFRAKEYDQAIRHFNETLRSPDLDLQKSAFYNLGNAHYAHGEHVDDPKIRQKSWEQAIQSYEAALTLQPKDSDAQHNRDFVKQRLEQLKEQQKQQQQQDKNSSPEDQKDQKDQDNSSKQDSQKDQQQKKDSSESKDPQDQNQDPQQNSSDEQDQQQKKQQDQQKEKDQKQDEKKPQSSQSKEQSPDKSKDGGADKKDSDAGSQGNPAEDASKANPDANAEPRQGAQMSPQQAMRLLDTAKGEERPMPLEKRRARARPVKDW
ncbi:MAG: VWA domain-containing protein [Verrucomicrobiales bacterium]|nr:VWA domain-containing protein [Verrucomicrobiales bacterium]